MSTTLDVLVAPPRERNLTASLVRMMPWLAAALVLAVGVAIVDPLPVGVVHDDGMYAIGKWRIVALVVVAGFESRLHPGGAVCAARSQGVGQLG